MHGHLKWVFPAHTLKAYQYQPPGCLFFPIDSSTSILALCRRATYVQSLELGYIASSRECCLVRKAKELQYWHQYTIYGLSLTAWPLRPLIGCSITWPMNVMSLAGSTRNSKVYFFILNPSRPADFFVFFK